MSYYGYPHQQYFGGNTFPQPPHHPFHPQQSFNFFTSPEAHQPSRHHRPAPSGHPGYHHHPAATAGPFGPLGGHHHYPEYVARHPHNHEDYDLGAEERATLAHLRSIQQRKEAEQASIRREAAIRAEIEKERQEALRRASAEAKKEREAAITRLIEERQKQRKEAIEKALAEQHRQQIQAAIQAKRQAYIEAHRARLIQVQQAQQAQQAQQERRHAQAAAAAAAAHQQKVECARRCATRCAARASRAVADKAKVEYKDEIEALNGLLGGLFGINIVHDEEEEVEKKASTDEKSNHVRFADKSPAVPAPAPASVPAAPEAGGSTKQPDFPSHVNDLLTQFLGLRIEPAQAADKPSQSTSAESANRVPGGLNEFLSQFGLVFEPLDENADTAEKSTEKEATPTSSTDLTVADPPVEPLPATTSASTSAAAASTPSSSVKKSPTEIDDAPLTSFLNSFTDLPPFVRDILGNVEIAFKEDLARQQAGEKEEVVEGKGKGVARGEKKEKSATPASAPTPAPQVTEPAKSVDIDTPVPTPSPSTSLTKLTSIANELDLVLESFTFPTTLSFGPTQPDSTPALLFNKVNSPYHAQANKLLQLLLAADSVASGGNKEVRKTRKEIVRAVEKELEKLEARRDEVWEEVRAKRENGVEEEEDHQGSGCSSEVGSSVDAGENHTADYEHVEHVEESGKEVEVATAVEAEGYTIPAKASEAAPEVEAAFTSPTTVADNSEAKDSDEPKSYAQVAKKDVDTDAGIEKPAAEVENKKEEEGYELL